MSIVRGAPTRGQAQSLVEFALVVPLFLLLLFSLIDFARLEFSYVSLTNATRELARSASIPESCSTPPATPCNTASPPTAADVKTSSVAIDQSFKNYEGMLLSAPNPATDTVTITVADRTCAAILAAGTGPCVAPDAVTTVTCTLPLDLIPTDAAYCAVPSRFGMSGGSVDVASTFRFTFNPLFQNRLTGIVDASFMLQWAALSTTARTYIE